MSYGAASQLDPMDSYNAGYAARLQAMLQGAPPPQSALDAGPDNSQPSDLGPDTYRNSSLPQGQQTGPPPDVAAPPQQPAGAPAQAPAPAPAPPGGSALASGGAPAQGGSPPTAPQDGSEGGPTPTQGGSALDDKGKDDKNGVTFRDLWKQQSKAQREKQMESFQAQLKQGNETIDSAYDQMMQKLGSRPQTELSKQDKGMLLMEFGMRMMRNSASPASGGFGGNVGAAAGAAGTDTMMSAQREKDTKETQAHQWDVQQQQIGIARGKEKANFAERSLLEQGRDDRAAGNQDSRVAINANTQDASGQRNDARIAGANERSAATIKQKNDQFYTANATKRDIAAGVQAGENARATQKSALTAGGGARGAAMKTAYDLYMSVHGNDTQGNPLPEEQLDPVRQDALKFAANPGKSGLSQGQLLDLATKDANKQYGTNSIQTMGMTEAEAENAKQAYISKTMRHLQSIMAGGGSALAPRAAPAAPGTPPAPGSALAAPGAPRGTTAPPPASPQGPPPASRPDGKVAPQGALQQLAKDPASAAAFAKRFGYLPPQYQKYLGPQRTNALQ